MFLSQESHSSWAGEETGGGKVVETGERLKSDRNRLLFHFCCFEVGGGRGWSGRKDLANDTTQRAISEGIPSKGVGRKKRVLIE